MTLATTYGPRFVWSFLSDDGYLYRLTLGRAGYDGPVRVLGEGAAADAGGDALSVTWAGLSGDALTPLSPVAASEMRVSIVDTLGGLVGEMEGSPDGAWQGTLHRCAHPDGEPDPGDALEWLGYALGARRDEMEILPGLTRSSLSLVDGLGLLASRPYAGEAASGISATGATLPAGTGGIAEPVLRSILRVLGPLSGGGTVTGGRLDAVAPTWREVRTAVRWWPRVAAEFGAGGYAQLPASVDPAAYICTKAAAWLDARTGTDGASASQSDALRTVAHRLSARLYQSEGVLRFEQRSALARTPSAVPVHVYPATDGAGGRFAYESETAPIYTGGSTTSEDWGYDPTPTPAVTEARVVDLHDTPGLAVQVGDARGSVLPVRTVESTYDHGALGNLVTNGSFEKARSGSPVVDGERTGADEWTQQAGIERVRLTDQYFTGFDETAGNAYGLRLGFVDSPGYPTATQAVPLNVSASDANVFEMSGVWFVPRENPLYFATGDLRPVTGGVQLVCTRPDGTVSRSTDVVVTLGADALPGRDTSVFLTTETVEGPLSPSVSGVVLPAGTVLSFGRPSGTAPADRRTYEDDPTGTVTLLEPLVAGTFGVRADVALAGEETDRLLAGDVALAHRWTSGAGVHTVGPEISAGGSLLYRHYGSTSRLSGVSDDGRPVEGSLVVSLRSNAPQQTLRTLVDTLTVRISLVSATGRTEEAAASTARAMLPAGATGTDAALPLSSAVRGDGFPVGDGPLPASDGALVVYASRTGASFDFVPTSAGGLADWSTDPYPDAGTSTARTGLGIEALTVTEALRSAEWHDAGTTARGPLLTMRAVASMRPEPAGSGGAGTPAFRLRPHHIRRVWHPAALVYPATDGTQTLTLTKPARPGGMVRIQTPDGGDGGTLDVEAVAGGAGGWAVDVFSPLGASLPVGTRVWISVLTWWDSSTWDVVAGTVSDELTELAYDPAPDHILQTSLSA